jgi:hypothetical protein
LTPSQEKPNDSKVFTSKKLAALTTLKKSLLHQAFRGAL